LLLLLAIIKHDAAKERESALTMTSSSSTLFLPLPCLC
jgi:hypothetical protein